MARLKVNSEKFKSGLRRAMWLFMALLFIISGVGISAAIFWQITRQDDTNQSQSENVLRGKPLSDFTPVNDVAGLQKIDKNAGSGAEVKPDSTVSVVYTGALAASGIIFESSADSGQPATFKLDQVIKGWQEGLVGMKAGGERRLLIPAELAYGADSPPGSGIPPNADLVFDIILLSIQ